MAKPQSSKLRFLMILHALFKYSDKKHRMKTSKLNEFLGSHNLAFKDHSVLQDAIRVMKEFGIDIRSNGSWGSYGVWIERGLLTETSLDRLVFAVSTNPHLTRDQATEILQSLVPLATVYQEPLLHSNIDNDAEPEKSQRLYEIYSVIKTAIINNGRIRCVINNKQLVLDNQYVDVKQEQGILYTPRHILQMRGELYVSGYCHANKEITVIKLLDIDSIKKTYRRNEPLTDVL